MLLHHVASVGFFVAGGDPAPARPVLRGTALCRAFGTVSFSRGESMLVVLRDPAVLVEDHVGPSV